jgi:uncharacterized repeat protein (TIGR03803 family)
MWDLAEGLDARRSIMTSAEHAPTLNFRRSRGTAVAIFAITLALLGLPGQAQTFTTLHSFTGGADGSEPFAGVSMDRAGNFYGTTAYGGSQRGICKAFGGCGTVYKLARRNSSWLFYTLYEFSGPDGNEPGTRVIVGPDGNLYGTTIAGGTAGAGTVFRLQPPATACKAYSCPWTETVLYSFQGGSDGANPQYGDLTFDQAGNIYGTTPYGGSGNSGVVYELSPTNGSWTETILHTFDGSDGYEPYAGVIFDSAGNLYGTGSGGGVGNGNVYKLTHSGSGWVESTIHDFAFPGGAYGGLISDSSGTLYGITFFTPQVYELSPTNGGWTYSVLYSFSGYGAVAAPTMDAAGNLYGTIVLGSNIEVFRLTASDGHWTLTGFNGSAGAEPFGSMVLDASGNLYGTASTGGAYDGGVVFEITP